MLQQTQVSTVIPYFNRFLERFPTVSDLAACEEADLMRLWEGLGYYRRAKSMHAAAKEIVGQHDAKFPTEFADVIALPGIGRYTAGAILSISMNQKLPILEGNTVRLFTRLIALREPPTEKRSNKLLWNFSEAILPNKNPGVFNQSLMELGALVCVPKKPRCDDCPVIKLCAAHELQIQDQIPGKVSKVKYEERTEYAFVVRKDSSSKVDRYLMRPLPEGVRWAGLWDFPRPVNESYESVATAAQSMEEELGSVIHPGIRLTRMRHAVTKYKIDLQVFAASLSPENLKTRVRKPWRFVSIEEMADLPMSVTARRICEFLREETQTTLPF